MNWSIGAERESSDERAGELQIVGVVAAGGAIGAIARWGAGEIIGGRQAIDDVYRFPWDTLFVNVLGCLLIGVAADRIARDSVQWSFTVTGILGGFTTMSAFAVESNEAADAGRNWSVMIYLAATLLGSAVAFAVGELLARRGRLPSCKQRGEAGK